MLYADETRKKFREVDQLHPLLVNEPWIFGDEWGLSFSETGLTRMISSILSHTKGIEFASEPVKLPSGKKGRVDMVFSRHLPESDRMRHLLDLASNEETSRAYLQSKYAEFIPPLAPPEKADQP